MKSKHIVIIIALLLVACGIFIGSAVLNWGNHRIPQELPVSTWDPYMFRTMRSLSSEQIDMFMKLLVTAIEQKDTESLKNLFAPNVLLNETTGEQIESLFQFFDGSVTSIYRPAASGHKSTDGGVRYEDICITCDVETTSGSYRMAVKIVMIDTENPKNVGICSLYIIDADNTNLQFSYWGSGEWRPGIVIE